MNLAEDITYEYIVRLRHHTDELGLVVRGHLLIEFVLNEIIRSSLKKPASILDDHRSFSFSVKARMLFATGHLPEHIFKNIRRVNSIRNHLAHDLDWTALKLDYLFNRKDDEVDGEIKIKDRVTGRKATPRRYIKMLCSGTLVQLRNHFFEKYGRFPSPRHSTRF